MSLVITSRRNNSGEKRRYRKLTKEKKKPCVFPFKIHGDLEEHFKCIDERHTKVNGKWCATEVDEEGYYTEWGYCKEPNPKSKPKPNFSLMGNRRMTLTNRRNNGNNANHGYSVNNGYIANNGRSSKRRNNGNGNNRNRTSVSVRRRSRNGNNGNNTRTKRNNGNGNNGLGARNITRRNNGNNYNNGNSVRTRRKGRSPSRSARRSRSRSRDRRSSASRRSHNNDAVDIPIQSLKYYDNSCYIHSLLACLFFRNSAYINARFLENPITEFRNNRGDLMTIDNESCSVEIRENIRTIMSNLNEYIHGNIGGEEADQSNMFRDYATCYNLRSITDNCRLFAEEWNDGGQKEVNEFLKYLLAVFPSDDSLVRTTILYTNDTETEINSMDGISELEGPIFRYSREERREVTIFLSPETINKFKRNDRLSNYITTINEQNNGEFTPDDQPNGERHQYQRRLEFNETIETPYIIFDLSRKIADQIHGGFGREKLLKKKIIPDEIIEINDRFYRFVSCVVREGGINGGHFTSYVLIDDVWYYFDDIGPIKERIGSYDDLLLDRKSFVKKKKFFIFL